MICHICGDKLEKKITDLPFKISHRSILIIKELPVLQCKNCREFLIEDPTMEKVDNILSKIDRSAELEIVNFREKEFIETPTAML